MSSNATPSPTVLMYASALCGYCAMAMRLLDSKGVDVDIRSVDGAPTVRGEMMERTGRTSVPQIFIGDAHVGGCDELYALDRNGQLDALLTGQG